MKSWTNSMGRRMKGLERGIFTLVELLVVVAIIMVLMALLMPSLGAARERAKTICCLSNQRQCGQGIWSYANDLNDCGIFYDGCYPIQQYMQRFWPDVLMWNGYLPDRTLAKDYFWGGCASIVTYPNIFSCPNVKPPLWHKCSTYSLTNYQESLSLAYGVRSNLGSYYPGERYLPVYVPLMSTMRPDALFLGDSIQVNFGTGTSARNAEKPSEVMQRVGVGHSSGDAV